MLVGPKAADLKEAIVEAMPGWEGHRYAVTLRVFVEASSDDEAQLILERHLAGSFDSEVAEVTEVTFFGRDE